VSPLNEHKDMIAITAYYRREAELKAQVDDLQRQLDNARTDWLCDTCDGRGCEAENQNTILLAELEKLQRENAALRAARKEQPYDTPRTDAKAQFFGFNPDEGEEFVQADFARELERENAALRAALSRIDTVWMNQEEAYADYCEAAWRMVEIARAAIAARKEQP